MKTPVIVALIVCIAALVGVYMYCESVRYEIQPAGEAVYKLDRKTGKVSWIVANRELAIKAEAR